MKKVIMLCSTLILGVWSDASAWEVDISDSEEPLTSKLSKVAVQERMDKLKETSEEEAKKQFRRIYNSWFNDSRKWSEEGKNSTLDSIQGYCKEGHIDNPGKDWKTNFKSLLERIEKRIAIRKADGEDRSTDQLVDLITIRDSMRSSLDGTTAISLPEGTFHFGYLSSLWKEAGVTVDPSFWSELANVWMIQLVHQDGAEKAKITSFLNHFRGTDTVKGGTWDLRSQNTLSDILAKFPGSNVPTEKNRMDFHLNVVTRTLQEMKVDESAGEWFDSFRYYMYLSVVEAISLIENSNE